jgi:hypothetical protein
MLRNVWLRLGLIFLLVMLLVVAVLRSAWYVVIAVFFSNLARVEHEVERLLRFWDEEE